LNIIDRDCALGEIDCGVANKFCEHSFGHAVDASATEGNADSGIAKGSFTIPSLYFDPDA
jgi:hypothetical protein